VLPISAEIAASSTSLGKDVGSDPADRLIAATAIHYRASLITSDQTLLRAGLPISVVK
jgi:PIN domain nuclease of toxin-antitoxin system